MDNVKQENSVASSSINTNSNDTISSSDIRKNNIFSVKILGVALVVILLFLTVVLFSMSNVRTQKLANIQKTADSQILESNFTDADRTIKEGLNNFPNDAGLLARQIDLLSAMGNQSGQENKMLESSKSLIDKGVKDHETDLQIILAAGYAYETAGEYETALTYYEKAIELDPKSSKAYFHKGHVLAFLNRTSESEQAYNKSNEFDPKNSLIQIKKSRDLYARKDYDGALQILNAQGSNNSISIFRRAEAFTAASLVEFGRGNTTEAMKYSQMAVEMDPTYSPGLGLNGYFLAFNQNSYNLGVTQLAKSLELNPRISLNYFLFGLIMRQYSFLDQAIALQKQGLSKISEDNTLVGQDAIITSRSRMNYELAQTYSLKSDVANTVLYLNLALNENQMYKAKIKNDLAAGLFANIKNDATFEAVINKL